MRSIAGRIVVMRFVRRDPPPRRVADATRHAPSPKWRGELEERRDILRHRGRVVGL
jgi:hypothetical protein